MSRRRDWVQRLLARPRGNVAAAVLLTLLAALALVPLPGKPSRLVIDASIERLMPADGAQSRALARVEEVFGVRDHVFVAVTLDQALEEPQLRAIERTAVALSRLPGVRRVHSLASASCPLEVDGILEVAPCTEQLRRHPRQRDALLRMLRRHPVFGGALLSADGRHAAFVLVTDGISDEDFRRQNLAARIQQTAREASGAGEVRVTGPQVVAAATAQALLEALRFVLPVALLLAVALLLVAFRHFATALVATAGIVVAIVWMLAIGALAGVPLNLVTAIAPPLVMTLMLAYSVHLLSEYAHGGRSGESPQQRLQRTLRRGGPPLLLAAATSIAGLLALLGNPLPAVRQFAWLAACGVAAGIVVLLLVVPPLLELCGCRAAQRQPVLRHYRRAADRLADFATAHRRAIAVGAVAFTAISLGFATQIRSGAEYIENFPPEAPVRADFAAINEAFGGATVIAVLIETWVDDALTDPERIRRIDELVRWLREQPEVGGAVSYADQLRLIAQVLEAPIGAGGLPDSAIAAKQLMVYGGGGELRRLIDNRFRTALIPVRIRVHDSRAIRALVERIEARLAALPPPLFAEVTGSAVIASRAVDQIASGQFVSVALALALIWALLAMMLTSTRAALQALLPNLLPVAAYFGMLGALDISLNPTTSLIACIVLGIAVDDTIHFLARFNADARRHGDEQRAVRSALRAVLRPVTLTTLALCAGFAAFTASELHNQVVFGLLAAATLAIAWLTDVTVTPALGSTMRVVTLWDLLRIDLGRDPTRTIPLFADLSPRQARTFALLSRMVEVPAGEILIREGESARDVYVVIDGRLEAFVERDGVRQSLSTMGRGAVIGEAGYFGQKRTASVQAVTPARLLRFDAEDLESLRRRHPRIAATIFRNLNRIQAERLARTTAMLR